MKLLRIRGANLNSLEGFEVDLTQAPLAKAGLFAITGETGAGKTTLLDAVTLALYGDYPRIAEAGGGQVPDPSGEKISSGDPRAALRRGTGVGFAEVDFIGVDGDGYRARWSVARARGRVDGNPQKVGRALYRLSDDSAVAQGKSDVAERAVALTGLNFGQFRRTVLLAQGEFDLFLMASEGDRAALLQRITDTGIYSRISSRVHQGTQERLNQVTTFHEKIAAVGLMHPDERASLEAELAALQNRVVTLKAERAVLAPAIERAMQVVKAKGAFEEAVAAQATAVAAHEAGSDERERLAQHDAVEPIRASWIERHRTEAERVRTAKGENTAETERHRLEAAAVEASIRSIEAERGMIHADRTIETSLPLWAEAARIDLERARAERDERSAVGLATKASDELVKAAAHATAKRGDVAEVERRRTEVQERLAARSGHDVLADDAGRIENLFDGYEKAIAQRVLDVAALAALRTEATAAGNEVENASAARPSLLSERDECERILGELRTARMGLDLHSLKARKGNLESLGALLVEHSRDHRHHHTATLRHGTAEAEGTQAVSRGALAEVRRRGAEAVLRDKESERRGLGMAVERASGAASNEAATLRASLVDGEPCPVCGSLEHHPAATSALEDLAQQLRDGMDALGREIQEASLAMATAAAEASTARAEATDAERRVAEMACEMVEIHDTFVARAPHIATALVACGIEGDVPRLGEAWTRDAWLPLSERMSEARHPVVQGMAEGDRLLGEIDGMSARRDDLLQRIDSLATAITEASERAQAVALRVAATEARLDAVKRAADDNERALSPYIAAAGIPLGRMAEASSGVAMTIASLGEERLALRREATGLEGVITSARTALEAAERALDVAVAAEHEATGVAERARATLSEWVSRRADLLDGEDVATHRSRLERAARDARDATAASRMAHALAIASADTARERHVDAIAAALTARDAAMAAAQVMADACVRLEHPEPYVIALLDTPRDEIDALRARVTTLVQAVRDAEGLVTARRGDLDRAVAEMAGVELPEDAPGRLVVLDAMVDGHTRSCGAMEERVQNDDGKRVLAEGLERGLAAAMSDLTVWGEVDDAIGSASGDRFARHAQEITLEALVGLANEQLTLIAPRYRLARGDALSLHVADQEMGGDQRASRSLSGGERFLVSLGLALALSGLEGRQGACDVLFIDEGFGALDATSLDAAVEALETLQALGRTVAVVTHVAAMIERIPTQVRVVKRGGGRSVVQVGSA